MTPPPNSTPEEKDHTGIVMAVAMPPMIWAIVHGARTRTLTEYLTYSSYISAPVSIVLLYLAYVEWRKPEARRWTPALYLLATIGGPVAAFLVSAIYYSFGIALKDLYLWTQSPSLSRTEAITVAALFTASIGASLFYFRLRLRSLYGLTETLVGVGVAAHRTYIEPATVARDPSFYLALLTAGVYLVVRGLDNVHQGIVKDPRDPAMAWFIASLRSRWAEAQIQAEETNILFLKIERALIRSEIAIGHQSTTRIDHPLLRSEQDYENVAKETVTVLLVTGESPNGEAIFAYVAVRADRLPEFTEAQGKGTFYPEDFGVIIESGVGTPSEEVRNKMITEYGFNHEAAVSITDVEKANSIVSSLKRSDA
jgi:hypothetical protein